MQFISFLAKARGCFQYIAQIASRYDAKEKIRNGCRRVDDRSQATLWVMGMRGVRLQKNDSFWCKISKNKICGNCKAQNIFHYIQQRKHIWTTMASVDSVKKIISFLATVNCRSAKSFHDIYKFYCKSQRMFLVHCSDCKRVWRQRKNKKWVQARWWSESGNFVSDGNARSATANQMLSGANFTRIRSAATATHRTSSRQADCARLTRQRSGISMKRRCKCHFFESGSVRRWF